MIKNTFLLLIIVAAALFSFSTYNAYADVFAKIDSIQGDVQAKGFENDIAISGFQFGVNIPVSSPTGGVGQHSGTPTFADLVITKATDKSSPALAKDLFAGTNIPRMDIYLTKPSPNGLFTFEHYILENVLISSYQASSGGDRPTESIGFVYDKLSTEFFPQNPDGTTGTPLTFCWDNVANKECTVPPTNTVPPAPAGSFNDPSNGDAITPCPAGTFTDTAGQSVCTPAPAGSFVSTTGATSATQCAPGTFSSSAGSTSCTQAPAGSFATGPGATSATPCPAGTFSSSTGSTSCTQAPAGSFATGPGATSATICPVGTFSANPGSASCTPAPAGSYVGTTGATSATQCAPGTFTSTEGQSVCTPAPAGSFATGPGATSSTPCPAGTFSANPGSVSCTQAPAGSFVGSTGATSATLCPAGTYCPNTGTVTPLACPVHFFCGVGTVTPLPEIESITPSTGGSQVTFSTGAGGFTSLNAINPSSLPTPPPPGSYPFGLFSFSIFGFAPATSVTTTITYPTPITPGTQYLKFVGGTWVAAPFTISGNTITMAIIDNGPLDSNPAVGAISDPSGIIVTTPGKVTGGGKVGKNVEFGLDANTGDDSKKIQGDFEYQNKTAHVNFHGHKIQLLSIDSTQTQATIVGTGTFDKKDNDDEKKKNPSVQYTFLVTVVDPDKKGTHDQLTVTITDGTSKVVYHDVETVKGHIEIHKTSEKNNNDHGNDKGK